MFFEACERPTSAACTVACQVTSRGDNDETLFRLRAQIQYCDNTGKDYIADFAQATNDWQLASVQFAKEEYKTVMQITVYCEYSNNLGDAYFDDIQLVRDRIETGLTAADFAVDTQPAENMSSGKQEEQPDFEVKDAYGNPLTETVSNDGEFGTIYRAFAYNCVGTCGNDLTEETDALGHVTRYGADYVTSRNETVTDRCGNKTEYTYDDSGRTTSLTAKNKEDTTLATVNYGYDAFDQLSSIERGDGMKYNLAYNAFHKLESIGVDGIATPLVQYAHKNGNGRLKQVSYANGDKMLASYNGLGQITAETWKDAAGVEKAKYKYIYDGSGNIVRSIDKVSLKEYNYTYETGKISRSDEYDVTLDANEIVTSKTLVCTMFYFYDTDGKLTKKRIRTADGAENVYSYMHSDGSMAVKLPTGATSHSKTDHLGRKEFDELQLGTGFLNRRFSYVTGEVTPQHTANSKLKSSPSTSLVQTISFWDGRTISYEYDEEERITKVTDSVDGETTYTYDAQGQLLTETKGGTTVSVTYDNYGNILTKGGVAYTYDSVWKDRLKTYDGTQITYDAGGNPLLYRGWAFAWEKGRQLKAAEKGSDSLSFKYNANGIRTSKTVGGVRHDYILDGSKILRESYGTTKLDYLYDKEKSICGLKYNGTACYFVKNLQGDIITITNSSGQMVARYTYDAWGTCTDIWDASGVGIASINPFRYRGYYFDTELGMYYLQSRYYDPVVGRFVNADGAVTSIFSQLELQRDNLYSYCANNVINNNDFTGYVFKEIFSFFKKIGKTLLDFFISLYDTENGTKIGKANKVIDATKKIASAGSEFKKRLKNYTKDVLNYYEVTNWVVKYYTDKKQIYSINELKRISKAKDNLRVYMYTVDNLRKHSENPYLNAKSLTEKQIEDLSLVMYAWDPKTFLEIYSYIGLARRL